MSRPKTFVPLVLVGVASAALAALASSKSWATVQADSVPSWLTSSGDAPLASALAIAALASWGALLVSRGRWRRWIAGLGLLLAVGSLVAAIVGYSMTLDDVRDAALRWVGTTAGSPEHTGWYWTALVADIVAVITLALAVKDVPRWPAMSSRYDSPTGEKGAARKKRGPQTSLDVWKAMDQGEDPTEGTES